MRVAMILKVRDEDDILEDNFRFHRAQGIDLFLATDNGSTDRTPEILEGFEGAGLARVFHEPEADMHEHGHEWYTRMAQLAATDHDADWVVVADADEFWWPLARTLRDTLAAVPDRYGLLFGARGEFVPAPEGPGTFAERLTVRERHARLRPKIAFRADPTAVLWHRGGHDVAYVPNGADLRSALRPPGRAVLRGVREQDEVGGGEPVPAPELGAVRILHFPIRSLDQFRRRIEAALLQEGPDPQTGKRARLRERYEREGVEALYADQVLDEQELEAAIAAGELVRDTRLRDFLARCPNPLEEGSANASPALMPLPPDELARERRELELDALSALARHQRLNEIRLDTTRERMRDIGVRWREMERTTKTQTAKALRRLERVKRLQGKVRRLRAELRRERRRPWSRARATLGRAIGRGR